MRQMIAILCLNKTYDNNFAKKGCITHLKNILIILCIYIEMNLQKKCPTERYTLLASYSAHTRYADILVHC